MKVVSSFALPLCFFHFRIVASTSSCTFLTPATSITYHLGQRVKVRWETNLSHVNLLVVQGNEVNRNSMLINENTNKSEYIWKVEANTSKPNIPFHFCIVDALDHTEDNTGRECLSSGFSVIEIGASQPTTTHSFPRSQTLGSQAVQTTLQTSASVLIPQFSQSSSSLTPEPSIAQQTLSTTPTSPVLRVSIGLSVGLGIPLFFALALIVYFWHQSRGSSSPSYEHGRWHHLESRPSWKRHTETSTQRCPFPSYNSMMEQKVKDRLACEVEVRVQPAELAGSCPWGKDSVRSPVELYAGGLSPRIPHSGDAET
ncbi:uncharacterized protein BDR25DRAFT_97673 [Lindgomyces ingoldianus]|uniref:Uncharacterized protein n=1 Tax=Lindgomyces ingoldianus TaxID=673940 RepID=A0ACB6QBB1_9PLEO|nr:uncharacterized protein BDR25DRAFT_97673 [Lindgomyces ingoldianus]KAF2464248.1 hypothetical protein BDR25DRAFT_97673 [Lindgomyces ingoldianus]